MKNKFYLLFIFFILNCSGIEAQNKILNIDAIIQKEAISKKNILIFFHMTHCGYCKRMEEKTFKDNDIQQSIKNNFVFVDINIDDTKEKLLFNNSSYSKKEFANELDVDFFPTVLFLDRESEVIYTSRGYRKVQKFKKILEYIETKSFEKIDFFDFYKAK